MDDMEKLFNTNTHKASSPTSDNTLERQNVNVDYHAKNAFDELIHTLQTEKERLEKLLYEFGDGSIREDLTIRRRNEIINEVSKIRPRIQEYYEALEDALKEDFKGMRGLTVSTNINLDAFSKLNYGKDKTKLSSKDTSMHDQHI